MELSNKLISEFVKSTTNSVKSKNENTVYGSIVKNGDAIYAKLDGSSILTPVYTTADVQNGERVIVLIKNHMATVTGNITSPAARTGDVQQLGINKLDANVAESTYATIDNLKIVDSNLENVRADTSEFMISMQDRVTLMDSRINNLKNDDGTSGIWKYKKWSNGDLELWGIYSIANLELTTKFGDLFCTSEIITPDFPFSVYDPILTASYESDKSGALLWPITSTSQNSPPNYYLMRPDNTTITNGKITFHVFGKWKNKEDTT